jgi:hypothetical protein
MWDARKTTVIRHNRWRCDLGWDIDLDDGSSNYHIRDNLCLSGGIKLREGYNRVVENNVLVNNTFHPHVWYRDCATVFRRNVIFAPYAPAGMRQETYGPAIDQNFLHDNSRDDSRENPRNAGPATSLRKISGGDQASTTGDALFVDETRGDFRVRDGSPVLRTGFRNFSMTGFGVVSERLRAMAKQPILPGSPEDAAIVNRGWGQSKVLSPHKKSRKTRWLGALVRNVRTAGDKSAAGLDAIRGVLVLEVAPESQAAKIGLRELDVILGLDGAVKDVREMLVRAKAARAGRSLTLEVWRDQAVIELTAASDSKR